MLKIEINSWFQYDYKLNRFVWRFLGHGLITMTFVLSPLNVLSPKPDVTLRLYLLMQPNTVLELHKEYLIKRNCAFGNLGDLPFVFSTL